MLEMAKKGKITGAEIKDALGSCHEHDKAIGAKTSSGLPPLTYDRWIMDDQGDAVSPVADDVLTGAIQARTLASDLIAGSDISSFGELQAVLARKSDVPCSLDVTFELELCWLRSATTSLEKAILTKTMQGLPAEDRQRTIMQASASIEELQRAQMFSLAPLAVQDQVKSVAVILHDMARGVAPKSLGAQASEFHNQVLYAVTFFFAEDVKGKKTTGKAAIVSFKQKLLAKMTAKEEVNMSDLESLRPYWHIFSAAQLAEMQTLSEYAVERVAGKRLVPEPVTNPGKMAEKWKNHPKMAQNWVCGHFSILRPFSCPVRILLTA